MEGKVFDGVISLQMRFKKRFFPDKPLERRKKRSRQILSQNNSAQIQGMKKQNHEIFGVFQNLG